jgi:hypothetical protein
MFKAFLVGVLREAIDTDKVKSAIADGVRSAIASSRTAVSFADKANEIVGVTSVRYDALGLKGKLLKGYLLQLLKELADESPAIAAGLRHGEPYIKAVLDGISPDEIATVSMSLYSFLKIQAIKVAKEQGLAE